MLGKKLLNISFIDAEQPVKPSYSTRQIQEFGFDIALPGVSRSPLRPIRSGRSRRTPQPELPPQRSSRRTPRSTPLFLNQSSGPTPATFNPKEAKESKESAKTRNQLTTQRLNSQSTRRDDSGTVTKKRRLADTPRSVEQLHTPIAKSTTNSSLNNPIGLEPQPSTLDSQARVDKEATEQARDGIVVSKNDQSPAVAHSSTKKRRKKRKSIVQTIRKRTSLGPRQPTLQRAIIPPPPPPITSDSSELPNQLPDDSSQLSRTIQSPLRSPRENLAQRKKRKKRVSIGRLPKHRKQPVKGLHATPTSLADSSISITRGQNRFPDSSSLPLEEIRESRRNRLPVLDAEEESHEEVGRENQYEEEDRIQVGKPRRKGLGDSTRLKDASVQDYLGGERVSAKNQGLNTSEREATSQERSERDSQDVESTPSLVTTKIRQKRRSVKRTSDSVPIAVHRLSQIQEVDEEEDARTDSIPLPKKVSVTAIDVLGQICRETIEKTMETMKKGAQHERNDRSRAEWERRQNCIEKYGDELDKRLFQMVS